MSRKLAVCLGILVIAFGLQSCSSSPEQGLLKSYFQAMSLNDLTTLSTMALAPIQVDLESWEITNIGEEDVQEFGLSELSAQVQDLEKKQNESVGTTLDAKDELEEAKYQLERSSGAARRNFQRQVDELQVKYDEIYENHKNLQKELNEARAAVSKETEMTLFSLSAREGDHPQIGDYSGSVHKKQVDVKIVEKGGSVKNYRIYLRKVVVQDPAINREYRGRWVIIRFEPLD